MIRILQCVNDMHRAGLETMLMNYYRNIDRNQIQFDFLTHRPGRSDYDDEIENLGGKVYYAPRLYPQNYPAYFKWMKQFFKEHSEYQIVHSHIDSMSYLPLLAAKKYNVPIRIAHSHSTSIDKDFKYILKQYYRLKINSVATERLACGEEAGKFLYRGKSYTVVPNAVDASKFYYDEMIRVKKRAELGITNEFVLGHVGRISYPKNHKFLVDIFREILKVDPNAFLLIIGAGEKEEEIKHYVKRFNLNSSIRFLGNRNDVAELYQVMDAFVLPSLFEGVPLVGVEAQFADLPCFFSDRVPLEVKFSEKSCFVKLDESAEHWAKRIISCKKEDRGRYSNDIVNSHYDIKVAHKLLEDYYLSFN
jgi:glycosyltransferase involved in cell wall biosynthesis